MTAEISNLAIHIKYCKSIGHWQVNKRAVGFQHVIQNTPLFLKSQTPCEAPPERTLGSVNFASVVLIRALPPTRLSRSTVS